MSRVDETGMGDENKQDEDSVRIQQANQSLQRSASNLEHAQETISKAMNADGLAAFIDIASNLGDVISGVGEKADELLNVLGNFPELLNNLDAILKEATIPALSGDLDKSQSVIALRGAQLIEKATASILHLANDLSAAMNGDAKAFGRVIGEVVPILVTEGLANYAKGQNLIKSANESSLISKEAAINNIAKGEKITSVSESVQKVLDIFAEIKESGGVIKPNKLSPTQEINLTLQKGEYKLNFRVETHPLPAKYGGNGLPQRHMNVDLYRNDKLLRNILPNDGHLIIK